MIQITVLIREGIIIITLSDYQAKQFQGFFYFLFKLYNDTKSRERVVTNNPQYLILCFLGLFDKCSTVICRFCFSFPETLRIYCLTLYLDILLGSKKTLYVRWVQRQKVNHFSFMTCEEAMDRKICPYHFGPKSSNTSPLVEQEQLYCLTHIWRDPLVRSSSFKVQVPGKSAQCIAILAF